MEHRKYDEDLEYSEAYDDEREKTTLPVREHSSSLKSFVKGVGNKIGLRAPKDRSIPIIKETPIQPKIQENITRIEISSFLEIYNKKFQTNFNTKTKHLVRELLSRVPSQNIHSGTKVEEDYIPAQGEGDVPTTTYTTYNSTNITFNINKYYIVRCTFHLSTGEPHAIEKVEIIYIGDKGKGTSRKRARKYKRKFTRKSRRKF